MQKKVFKSEKGSITLFVLLAILFFLIVIFSVFINSSNKNRIQLAELDKIKQEYDKTLEGIDKIYEDITKDSIFIIFRTPDGKLHPESRWTNQDLTVKIYYPEGTADENKLVKLDDGTYKNYTGEFTINKSTKITAKIRDGKEKEANAKIDKTSPTYTTDPIVTAFPIPANSNVADINVSINASDTDSGLNKLEYAFMEDTSTPTSYTEIQNDEPLTFKSKPQGTYYLWLRIEDNVGNITNEKVELNVVDYVAKIGDTYYVTLQDAINACPTNGTATQIDVIKSITYRPNTVVPSGVNATINLNGYSITGTGTLIENNGTLTIIDTNTANTGEITSTDGTVIQNNGTFTLGANDGIVNQTSPVLTGENMVINSSGTFNFYDGVLIAYKAIEGNISSQPDEYSVISKKQGDKERVYLGVLAESAARIDKWFYNTLEEAIADCPENAGDQKTTITVLRDLSLTTKATIDNGKNVIIDLNGHSITNTISDYVIENSSTLEILDSTEAKTGSINGVNYSTVLNNRDANLTISSGTISLSKSGTSSSNYYSSVRNEGEFLLKDNGNIQTTQSSYTYAVYNNGLMKTSGGNVDAMGIAIYNTIDSYISEDGMNYEDISIDDIVNNGTYYFEKDENGNLVSNNTGVHSSTANSYIEIDLENEIGNFVVEVNAEISSENSDRGYATITESESAPSYSSSTGRFMYISGTTESQTYTKELEGGKKYYLHFGYRKDSSVNRGNDILTIHSIKAGKYAQTLGELKLENCIIKGTTSLYNNSNKDLTISSGKIEGFSSTGTSYGIYNNSTATLTLNNIEISSDSTYFQSSEAYGIYNNTTSEININGGKISCSTQYQYKNAYGIYNNSTGKINVNTTIELDSDYAYGIYNKSTAEINITGGTISLKNFSRGYGIYNNDLGNIYFHKGTVTMSTSATSSIYGIYNKSTGTIIIGENDGTIDESLIEISAITTSSSGKSYGLYNTSGILNFYDGIITGTEIIDGTITSIADESEIKITMENSQQKNAILIPFQGPVAQIGNTTYNTLQEAFDAVEDDKEEVTTVNLLRDITIIKTEDIPIVSENKKIFLNMNAYTISSEVENTIENRGQLEIGNKQESIPITSKDLINNGTYYFIDDGTGAMIPNNTGIRSSDANSYIELDLTNFNGLYQLTLNAEVSSDGTYDAGYVTITETTTAPKYNDSTGRIVYISGQQEAQDYSTELEGGKVYYIHLGFHSTNTVADTFKINSITLTPSAKIVANNGTCIINHEKLTISDGITISSHSCGIYNEDIGEINTTNANFLISLPYVSSAKLYAIYNEGTGKITLDDSTITLNASYSLGSSTSTPSLYGIYNTESEIIINNTDISSYSSSSSNYYYSYGIYNKSGKIDISESNISLSSSASSTYSMYGIYNDTGDINISRSNIFSTFNSWNESYGIYNNGTGKICMDQGKIYTSSSRNSYGIYNKDIGIIQIGINDGNVSKIVPDIQAETSSSSNSYQSYGIYNDIGEIYFYDGKVSGTTSISGTITEIATGCDIIKEVTSKIETSTLDTSPVAQINDTKYQTLQDAFNAVEDNLEEPTVINLLRNTTILNENSTPIVSENKNIFLNLNGYSISAGNESGIENRGQLEIGDKQKDPIITANDLTNNGDYYFISNENGAFISNNTGINSSIANSYIKIDLTNSTGKHQLVINAEISSKGGYDTGYVTVTESPEAPAYNSSSGRIISMSGIYRARDFVSELESGKIYYLHLGYRKTNSKGEGEDRFKINSIKLNPAGNIIATNGNCITNLGNLTISDGLTLNSNMYAVNNTGELQINGGYIYSENGIYNDDDGIVNFNNGKIYKEENEYETTSYAIYNNSNGTININGGNIEYLATSSANLYGIYNNSTGTVNINGGNISTYLAANFGGTYYLYGIYNNGTGQINLVDGNIYSKGGHSYGIYNNSTGTIFIGKNDEIVNKVTPRIQTELYTGSQVEQLAYGIYNNSGNLIFYDGEISGITAIFGNITETAPGYDVIKNYNDDIEIVSLDNSPVAQVNNQTYRTLQEAFDSVEDNKEEQTEVKLLRNITILSENLNPIINTNKNIFLNMNGYVIITENETGIENQGTLKIGDKSEDLIYTASDLVNNGSYYFEADETGAIIPNNINQGVSVANSYIKLDLRNLEGTYKITINAETSFSAFDNYAYATIIESTEAPEYNSSAGRFMYIYTSIEATDFTAEIQGGKLYYLHLGYRKTTKTIDEKESFKINSIKAHQLGKIKSTKGNCITNSGNLTITEGVELLSSVYGIYNQSGEINMNGGSILATSLTSNTAGIYNDSTQKINITGGTISAFCGEERNYTYGIYNNNTGEINMNGGNILVETDYDSTYSYSYAIYNKSSGKINIQDGYLYSESTSSSNAYGIYNNEGRIEMSGGTIEISSRDAAYGISNNSGNILINGGSIISKNTGSYVYASSYAITNNSNGELIIDGGTIESSAQKNSYSIQNSGNLYIYKGDISSTCNSKYQSYGISNTGILTLGKNDGTINVSEPNILSTGSSVSSAIKNTGTFNFYDGKISGPITITGNITEVAPGYEIKKTTADGISTDILALSATDNTVCVLNSINYSSLQDALDACTGTENYTISLTNVCELTEPLTIPEGKNITLSINGFDIYYDGSDSMIINNGTLTIKDTNTVSSGNLSNTIGNVIENNGTLIIGDNDGNVTSRSPHITGTDIAITNNGTIEFYDGTITGITPISGNDIKTIPEDYNLVETTENNLKTLSLIGIAPEVTYTTENVSGGTKITVTATDTNLSMIINPDDSEVTGSDTEIVSEYIATSSGMYTFKAIDKNNNVTTINVAV